MRVQLELKLIESLKGLESKIYLFKECLCQLLVSVEVAMYRSEEVQNQSKGIEIHT